MEMGIDTDNALPQKYPTEPRNEATYGEGLKSFGKVVGANAGAAIEHDEEVDREPIEDLLNSLVRPSDCNKSTYRSSELYVILQVSSVSTYALYYSIM